MSTDWLSQPLSIQSIASQYTLPIVIRSALGFRGSSRPIILHSIIDITFVYGRALKKQQSKKSHYQLFRPIDSEIVAIPIKYPGYFECIQPSSHGPEDGVLPEKSIRPIIERMQLDYRTQLFYIASPIRVYTLETNSNGERNRLWHDIESNQLIMMEELIYIEYTPTEKDNLTADDYGYSWWFCFSKHILKRSEYVIKCLLSNERICYIPCSSTDEICLYPIGQHGSTNIYKLHTIENLIEQFSLPLNIKLAQFPGFDTYKDFSGYVQILGLHTKEFAICGSLSSTNVSLLSLKTPIKFVVAPIPLTSVEILEQLSCCEIFIQSFDKQIRRILISTHETSSHRSRSKHQSIINGKRSSSVESMDPFILNEDTYRSRPLTEKRGNGFRKQRAISTSTDNTLPRAKIKRALSNDDSSIYNSLVYPIQTKNVLKLSSVPVSLSKKRHQFTSQLSTPFTYDTGSNLMQDMDLPNADGSILFDDNIELFSSVKQ